jgi:calcium binding protein 39
MMLHPALLYLLVAADVFATFKDLLTRHKALIAQFLADNYAEVRRLW